MDRVCRTDKIREMHAKFWFENLEGRDHSEDLGVKDKIRMDLGEIGRKGVSELDSSGSG
jgi:hypothetical protein